MKRIRIVGVVLVAVVAMSAIVAASASAAAPEYLICGKAAKSGKTYTGKFTGKTCEASSKVETGGKYELAPWTAAKKTAFKNTNGKSVLTVYIPGVGTVGDTECAKGKGVGQVTGPNTGTTVVTFEKCESSGKTCTSAGAKKGDIVTQTLDTKLVAISGGSGVGNEIKGAGPGGESAAFDCEGEELTTTGAVTGEVTGDVGVASKDSSNIFTLNGEGGPAITSSEPLYTTIVEGGKEVGTLPSGEDTTASVKGEAFYIS
jgi:hypothetical protein